MTDPARRQQDEAEIRALIAQWSRAVEARDAKGAVAAYTADTVLYDAIPPGRTVGAEAIAALWEACFPYFPERFRSEHRDLEIAVDGDVAFVHGLHHFVPEPADHPCGQTSMRITAGFRRIAGAWRIVHEHVSIPFDPMTGKAVYLGPGGESLGTEPATCDATAQPASTAPVAPVTPHLVCAGAAKAIDFYKAAFDATEMIRLPGPDGRLIHAAVSINGVPVMLVDEFPDAGPMANVSPQTLKGTPVTVHLNVEDVDAVTARAIAAGARVVMPVADMFWGDRYGVIEDPFGHHWSIATQQRALSMDELRSAADAALRAGPTC